MQSSPHTHDRKLACARHVCAIAAAYVRSAQPDHANRAVVRTWSEVAEGGPVWAAEVAGAAALLARVQAHTDTGLGKRTQNALAQVQACLREDHGIAVDHRTTPSRIAHAFGPWAEIA